MLKSITKLFEGLRPGSSEDSEESRGHSLKLATALLLVEVARADYAEDITEDQTILDQLANFFDLTEDDSALLVQQARAEADHAASLQIFTRQLHESLSLEEKHQVVEMLWRVAMADEHLDKHEDHLVRKVAGLLYISHGDLIRIRNRVKHAG